MARHLASASVAALMMVWTGSASGQASSTLPPPTTPATANIATGGIDDPSYAALPPGQTLAKLANPNAGTESWQRIAEDALLAQSITLGIRALVGRFRPATILSATYSNLRAGFDLSGSGTLHEKTGWHMGLKVVSFSPGRAGMVREMENLAVVLRQNASGFPDRSGLDAIQTAARRAGETYAAWSGMPRVALIAGAGYAEGYGHVTHGGVAASWLRPLGPAVGGTPSGVILGATTEYTRVSGIAGSSVCVWNPTFVLAWQDKVALWHEDHVSRWSCRVGVTAGVRNTLSEAAPIAGFVQVRIQPSAKAGMSAGAFAARSFDVTLTAGRDSSKNTVWGLGFSVLR